MSNEVTPKTPTTIPCSICPTAYQCARRGCLAELNKQSRETRKRCKHGDPFCPCQDGDTCHYEGKNSMSITVNQGGPQQALCGSGNSAAPQKERQPECNCMAMSGNGAMMQDCKDPACQYYFGKYLVTGKLKSVPIHPPDALTREEPPIIEIAAQQREGLSSAGLIADVKPLSPDPVAYLKAERPGMCILCVVPIYVGDLIHVGKYENTIVAAHHLCVNENLAESVKYGFNTGGVA